MEPYQDEPLISVVGAAAEVSWSSESSDTQSEVESGDPSTATDARERPSEARSCLMAAIPCQDRSTQCLLCPTPAWSLSDLSLCHSEIAHLLSMDSSQGDCKSNCKSPASSPAVKAQKGRSRARGRGKRAGNQPAARPYTNGNVGKEEDTVTGTALKNIRRVNSCLTRLARQRLSLPSHLLTTDPTAAEKATGRQDTKNGTKKTPKRRASDGGVLMQRGGPGRRVTMHSAAATDLGESCAVVSAVDRNINASEGCEDPQIKQTRMDQNSNARKAKHRKARFVAKRANVRGRKRTKSSGTHIVNLSALKPISAVCSSSGLGLVVTYRPVFSETTRKRRAKRQNRTAAHINSANNNTQPSVCRRDSGTNPRTPSPEKQKRGESPSFFDQISAFTKRRASPGKKRGVTTWLQDIPHDSPRVRKHRLPSPSRGTKSSSERELFPEPFVVANHSHRKSPIPGPSWTPDELTRPRSRPRSSSRSPHRRRDGTVNPRSRKHGPECPGSTMAEVVAVNSPRSSPRATRGRQGQLSPLSPALSSRPVRSEGWKVRRSKSPDRKSISPRGRYEGEDGNDGWGPQIIKSPTPAAAHMPPQRDQATSVSRTRHHIVSRSRSNTRSPRFSPSPTQRESRGGHNDREWGHWGEHNRHRRQHRRRYDREDYENKTKGAGGCILM